MPLNDYPADLRADYPERSSRGWAVLTILLIKFLALIPHFIVLFFLGIAQFVVAFIAQFVVAFRGEYPAGMHEFVTGVLRWGTRVTSFVFSLTDTYPPFTLKPVDDYPIDVIVERPASSNRAYAIFTIIVQLLALAGVIWLGAWMVQHADTVASWSSENGSTSYQFNLQSSYGTGLLLRQIAAIPHIIVLLFIGIAAFVLWFVVQWVILFVAGFPRGMWDVVAGYVRWYTRVNAYTLGLIDRYPPFTMSPSLAAAEPGARLTPPPPATWPAAPPAPPAPQTPPLQSDAPPETPPETPGPAAPAPPEPPKTP